MHTEPLTDIDRTLLRQRAGFRGRLFYWVGIIVGLALLAFTAFIVLPPIIQGYEFRDLDVLAEAWVVAATMFAVCYLIIGLFERRATSSVREDVIDNIKEVHTGKVISIEEKTELEPTELHLLEDANAERFKIHLEQFVSSICSLIHSVRTSQTGESFESRSRLIRRSS